MHDNLRPWQRAILALGPWGPCEQAKQWILANPGMAPGHAWQRCPNGGWIAWLFAQDGLPSHHPSVYPHIRLAVRDMLSYAYPLLPMSLQQAGSELLDRMSMFGCTVPSCLENRFAPGLHLGAQPMFHRAVVWDRQSEYSRPDDLEAITDDAEYFGLHRTEIAKMFRRYVDWRDVQQLLLDQTGAQPCDK